LFVAAVRAGKVSIFGAVLTPLMVIPFGRLGNRDARLGRFYCPLRRVWLRYVNKLIWFLFLVQTKSNAKREFLSILETNAPYNLLQDFSYLAFSSIFCPSIF
jgi:hypothetical protein